MKKLLAIFFVLIISQASFGQTRLVENFDYAAGDSLGAHGWTSFSGGATNRLVVTTPGLSYAGYPYAGVGNATTLATTGQDAYKPLSSNIDSTNSKTAYAFFLVNFASAQVGGEYFLAFLPSTSTTFYSGRVFARDNGGNLNFGIAKSSPQDTLNSFMWSPNNYSYNTTYLLVLKYEIFPGASNDAVSLFIFNSGMPATEPAVPTLGPFVYTSGDAGNIGRISLRQGVAARGPVVTIDDIFVTSSWFTTDLDVAFAVQAMVNENTGRLNRKDSATVYLRNTTSPYAIVDSAWAIIDSVTYAGKFSFKNVNSGTYYLDVRFRRSPLFRNGIETWSRSGGEALTKYNGFSYSFVTDANKAYGNNQVLTGGVYSFYSGDVDQDGIVDGTDASLIDNDAFNFIDGYKDTDLNGDRFIDGSDASYTDNNAFAFVGKITP